MALLVGDAVIDNPIDWTLAEVKLTFLNKPSADSASADQYQPKPSIDHMFRSVRLSLLSLTVIVNDRL